MFPAHFLGLAFASVGPASAEMTMPIGAHAESRNGKVAIAAVAVMADVALAAALRGEGGPTVRLATLSIRLSFSRLPTDGVLRAVAERQFGLDTLSMPTAVSRLTVCDAAGISCTGEASFAVLDSRRSSVANPMPGHATVDELPPLRLDDMTDAELKVLEQARAASRRVVSGGASFLEALWELVPEVDADGASCRLHAGLHVSNRIGHLQGGVLLGLAAHTSAAAAPEGWHLLDLTAQYIEAGAGTWVQARAAAVRIGRSSASIECRITDDQGRTTLCAQATFIRTPSHG
jgi:acyl-coenzyme A thioesterase PaaI-like protein